MSQTLQRPNPGAEPELVPASPPERSGLERFFDSFFREENIKWMSVIGAAIVLASSLMLVSHQWKSWPAEFKYVVILGYTIGAYVCAQVGRTRFGLRTTSTVLQLLTLLLIPLCFMALSWLQASGNSLRVMLETIALMLPAAAFMRYAACRIFDNLLRGRQATFAYSYMLLSMACVLPPASTPALAGALAVALWLVMSLGVIKVNRHIFWMTEEHQQPRVFAFFPIALLSSQFLMLVAMKALSVIPYEWLGLGCVLVSVTVLLTARAVAEVFKQRTGDLVRPLPWNLVLPLVVGLALLVLGVAVSFYGFSMRGPTTVAAVPTALLAGMLLCVVAWDTGLSTFAWGALVLFAIAYQTSPTLIAGLIQQLKQHAATAVNEPALPVAFYGITYLPLIVAMMIASRCCELGSRGRYERLKLFVEPLRRFATMLTIGLFLLSIFHFKALAIVSILDVPLLISMAILFRNRRYAYAGLASLVLSSALVVPLVGAMGWAAISPWHIITSMAALALALVTIPGIDRSLLRIPLPGGTAKTSGDEHTSQPLAICMIVGYGLALALSACLTITVCLEWPDISGRAVMQFVLLLSTLLITTVRTRDYLCGISFWLFSGIGAMVVLAHINAPWATVLSACSIATATISLAGYYAIAWMRRRSPEVTWASIRTSSAENYALKPSAFDAPSHALSKTSLSGQAPLAATLVVSLSDLSMAVAMGLAVLFYLPSLALANFAAQPLTLPLATSVMVFWGIAIALIFRSRTEAAATAAAIPLWAWAILNTCVVDSMSFSMQAFVWMVAAGCTALGASKLAASGGAVRPWRAASLAAQVWVNGLVILSLFNADPMFRVVGLIGLAIGYILNRKRLDRVPGTVVAILANLHLFIFVVSLYGIQGWCHQWIADSSLTDAVVTLLPFFGLSILLFDARRVPLDRQLRIIWSACLRNFAVGTIILAFGLGNMLVHLLPAIVFGMVIVAIAELIQAVRYQSELFVWLGLGALGIAGLWLVRVGVIEVGMGISQIGLVAASAIGLLLAHLLSGHARYGIFARPMLGIGLTCPALLTGMAVLHQLNSPTATVDPLNTLAMLGAAAVYFHQGLVRKQRRYVLSAVAIANLALMFTWRGLHIHDAQFYCIPLGLSLIAIVQLLKRELPKSAHDPLRYAGALVMLVSPMFEIVSGSWLHLLTLLALSVCVILLAIGLRLRALIHTGTAFLLADLVMMVVRSSIDHPSLLWICGLGLGGGVIVLAAICERHREQVLSRIRMLSAELATWN